MVYEIKMMDDRGRFVRALRALDVAGTVAIVDFGGSIPSLATTFAHIPA